MSTKLRKTTSEPRSNGLVRILDGPNKILAKRPEDSLSRRLTTSAAGLRCPHCESIVYSRRHKLCGVCGEALPEGYLFTPEEAQRLENILRNEQRRHRQWMTKTFHTAVAAPYVPA